MGKYLGILLVSGYLLIPTQVLGYEADIQGQANQKISRENKNNADQTNKFMKEKIKIHESQIELNTNAAAAHKSLGHIYRKLNNPAHALKHYKAYIQLQPSDWKIAIKAGMYAHKHSYYSDAITFFEMVKDKNNPNNYLSAYSESCYRAGNPAKAIDIFAMLVEKTMVNSR